MNWWNRLQKNTLAKFGAILLIFFYFIVILADFVAPYDPYDSQMNGSLLPPTSIHWVAPSGQFIGPHIYPTTQGKTSLETGERKLVVDQTKPTALKLFVAGSEYELFKLTLSLPPQWKEVTIIPGIKLNWHLFGTENKDVKFNILGTDEQGRDQFSRLLYGGRLSMFIGIFGIIITYPIALFIGGISGYFGGIIDKIIMTISEVLMTFPSIYLLVAISGILSTKLTSSQRFLLIVLITSFISWAGLARVIRGQVLSIKEREFVQAARAMGATPIYIIVNHVLPQTASYIIISATLTIPSFIGAEAVLSLIGLGIQQPDPSWGNMLSLASNASILVLQPWLIWPPAILIILTVLAFNLLGDGLRDALDPRNLER
ncbi:ABC transporter permease [Anabaena sp. FACHB-1237]|uniref:ABC transporter permease n=1 Tax=Anabaena sp. FACHB-1237 TaxID=2692769 RepID=UPI00167FFCF7|nr:ABC transporter permease [Anabaena sp. FACHB-1237]MBD2138467.1 ABC transporter permease [Anabaena sp. FACHB-1237]